MSHWKKYLLFASLMVASLSAVSSAGAATATITGGPTVTGSSGVTLLKLHTANKTLSCTNSAANGTVVASASGTFPPGFRVGTVTPGFSGCTIVGGLGIGVNCQPAAFLVTGLTSAGGHTPGAITGINCHIYVTSQTACRIRVIGSVGARFQNPPPKATITVDANHEALSVVDSTNGAGGACAPLPNDPSARFTNGAGSDSVYDVLPSGMTVNVTP